MTDKPGMGPTPDYRSPERIAEEKRALDPMNEVLKQIKLIRGDILALTNKVDKLIAAGGER